MTGAVFCDAEWHVDACCAAAPDFLPPREDALLDEKQRFLRQPSGEEVASLLVTEVQGMKERGIVSELSAQHICGLIASTLPLVDNEWWDERSDED